MLDKISIICIVYCTHECSSILNFGEYNAKMCNYYIKRTETSIVKSLQSSVHTNYMSINIFCFPKYGICYNILYIFTCLYPLS